MHCLGKASEGVANTAENVGKAAEIFSTEHAAIYQSWLTFGLLEAVMEFPLPEADRWIISSYPF